MQVDTSTTNICTRHDGSRKKNDARTRSVPGKIYQIEELRSYLDPFFPKGTWGVAIVEVASEPEPQILGINDPAVQAGLKFEVYPMPGAIVRK